MKKILFIQLCFCLQFNANAQNEKAFTISSFQGTRGEVLALPEVTPDGKKLVIDRTVIDPYAREQSELKPIGKDPGLFTICYSPDHKYRVINTIDSKYTAVTNEKNKSKDWVSIGYCSTDTSWHYKSYEDNYAIGVTDAGVVLCTSPAGFNSKSYPLKIERMKGIWRYDPKSGMKTQVSDDVLYDDSFFRASVFNTQDRKKMIIQRQHKHVPAEIVVYELASGNKHSFNVDGFNDIISVGNDIMLMKDMSETGTSKEVTLLSLDDGHKLLSADQLVSDGGSNHFSYKLSNCFLSGNNFYFLHPVDFSVAKMQLENGKMSINTITKLDTAGLKLALYSSGVTTVKYEEKNGQRIRTETKPDGRSRYCLAVLKDYYVIFPEYVPEGYQKPYPLFMYFMHPESGEALLAMKPFFAQPVYRDYAEERAKEEERQRKNQQECNSKLAASPFQVGALLRKRGSSCKTPSFIWGGVNCTTLQFQAFGITGPLRGYEIIKNPSELEVCDVGPYTICSYCRGAGSYKKWGTVSDNGWKQTNFNVYVLDPNGIKAVQLDHYCDVCNGKGYYR